MSEQELHLRAAFQDFFLGRRVVVTGSTGFKGSWLCVWLKELGAEVTGIGLDPLPDAPSHYGLLELGGQITQRIGDVTDPAFVRQCLDDARAQTIFHLAGQSLVKQSILDPRSTFQVNCIGTITLLMEAARTPSTSEVVCITSDKCYENQNWDWAYRETDALGGEDPYSASKAATELAVDSFRRSVLPYMDRSDLFVATARAGNVIGGGDWSANRLIPDLVRWALEGEDLHIRDLGATRPWQHVLEPLSGYLSLASRLTQLSGACSAWNFGPSQQRPVSVMELVERFGRAVTDGTNRPPLTVPSRQASFSEAHYLQLDSAKAYQSLGWSTTWDLSRTVQMTADWYKQTQVEKVDYWSLATSQIRAYCEDAYKGVQPWIK